MLVRASQRDLHAQDGPRLAPAADAHPPAEVGRPLLHADQAEGVGVLGLGRGDPAAVVADRGREQALAGLDADGHARGPGVAGHVGQGLLHDAEQGGGLFPGDGQVLRRRG